MKPLRNYVLLTFLSDEEEVTGSGLYIAGAKTVQRARILDCGSDVSFAVKAAHTVVLRKNNTAIQVNGVARNTYLVQETDILAIEQTVEEKVLLELNEELDTLHRELETCRSPPPDIECLNCGTITPGRSIPDVVPLDEPIPFGISEPNHDIPAQAETDPEDEKEQ